MRRIFIIILFTAAASCISASPKDHKADSLMRLLDQYYFSQGTLSRGLIKDFYELAQEYPNEKPLLAQAVFWEAYVNHSHGISDSVLTSKINTLLAFYDEDIYKHEKALLIHANALANLRQGNYAEAFYNAVKALEVFEQLSDTFFMVKSLNLVGNICSNIQNFNMAEEYYDRALTIVDTTWKEYYQVQLNKYRILFLRQDYEQAINSMLQFMPKIEAYKDTSLLAMAYQNLGAYYVVSGRYDEAYRCYMAVLNFVKHIDNDKILSGLYQTMGYYYYLIDEYDSSYFYSKKAKELVVSNNNIEQLANINITLSNIFLKEHNCDSALFYLQEYTSIREHLMNNPKTVEVYQSYVSMLIESAENQLTISQQNLLLRNRQMIVTAMSAIIVIAIIILILIITLQNRRNIRQRSLLKEIENKELSDRIQQEEKIQELQKEKMEAQIREITSYSLLVSSKNAMLQQIIELTEQLSPDPQKIEEVSDQIKSIAKSNSHLENDWNNFVAHFNQVHPRFFESLQMQYPLLSKNDLKLAAYIRMGMSIKQIAQMLNFTPDSVKVSRYRLRQKLNLKRSDNLDDFIQAI